MNKLVSTIRIAVLWALSTAAFILIFGEELDENLSAWTIHFLIDKALAALAIYIVVRLYKRWRKIDPWIIAYEKYNMEPEETPDSAYLKKQEG